MRLRVMAVLLLVAVGSAIYFASQWHRSENSRAQTLRWTHAVMDSLGTKLTPPGPPVGPEGRDSVYWQWVATTAQLQSRRWQAAVHHWAELRSSTLDEADVEDLRRQGLQNPPNQLRESLVHHPELIPFPGVLGGTMMILPDDKIALLRAPYAFAEFDDGHINGVMLVKYTIRAGGQIEWKRLWATLD
jgi:hypothetical protein